LVVPAEATMQNGRRPAVRSAAIVSRNRSVWIRKCMSVGIWCTFDGGSPASIAAFCTEWCAWSDV
jgi:hypothetical protein